MRVLPALISALPVLAQSPTAQAAASKKVHRLAPGAAQKAAAQAVNQAFAEAFVKGDARAVAALYTEDAELLFFKGNTFMGRGAIQAFLEAFLKDTTVKAMTITSDETRLIGDALLDISHYEMTTVGKDGKEEVGKGRAMAVLRKERDGKWRLWRDCPLPD